MSYKRLNNKQVEINTEKFDIYIEKNRYGFILDYFKTSISNADKAHVSSEGHEDIESLERQLKRLGVEEKDLLDFKKGFNLN